MAGCGPPSPIIINDTGSDCRWYQGGGDYNRSSYVPIGSSSGAKLAWTRSFKDRLNIEPTAAFGAILIPTADRLLHVISIDDGLSIAKKRYKKAIVAPVIISDSLAVLITEDDKLIVVDWVLSKSIWEADLGGSIIEPLIMDNRIYWFDGQNYIRCFELENGQRVWDKKLEEIYTAPLSGSPSGIFAVCDEGIIDCLDPLSGDLIWSYNIGARVRNAPVIVGQNLYFCAANGIVGRLNALNGSLLWETDLNSPVIAPLGADNEGIFVGTNNRYIFKLDSKTGDPVWNLKIGGPIKAGPLITDKLAVFVSIDYKIYFVDKNSGKIITEYLTDGMLTTRPLACGENVYIAGEDKNLYCFNISGE